MPSEHSPGGGRYDREEFPEVEAAIGEDPARFLDRDLKAESDGTLDGSEISGTLALARIRGLDDLEVVSAWINVETSLERGPRKYVVAELNQRRRELRKRGERPDDVELAHAAARARAENPEWRETEAVDLPPWRVRMGIPSGGGSGTASSPESDRDASEQSGLDAIATDGGEP